MNDDDDDADDGANDEDDDRSLWQIETFREHEWKKTEFFCLIFLLFYDKIELSWQKEIRQQRVSQVAIFSAAVYL